MDSTDITFLSDLFATVQSLVDEFQLAAYRLIVNAGEYQDFPQLHFHLTLDVGAGCEASRPGSGKITSPLQK